MSGANVCACSGCTTAVPDNGDLCAKCRKAECDDSGKEECRRPDFVKPRILGSGYTNCACPDCFDITVSDEIARPEMCSDCEEAGCDGEGDCQRDDAYGMEDNDVVEQR